MIRVLSRIFGRNWECKLILGKIMGQISTIKIFGEGGGGGGGNSVIWGKFPPPPVDSLMY